MKKCKETASGEKCAAPRLITKFTEYVGSFAVEESDWRRRLWMIEEQMHVLKDCPRRRAVVLKFCLRGVRMYGADGETLLMAHALRRIRYTTCRLDHSQFAFVSRNPGCHESRLFCHLFVGSEAREAQVLNLLLCRSFQLHYLRTHPEAAAFSHEEVSSGAVVREALACGEVSQNVNALVSFRRLMVTAQVKHGSNRKSQPLPSRSSSPYCSPTLVRKKAIRSKGLHSGTYGGPKPRESGAEGRAGSEVMELPETLEVLLDAVWFCAGVLRDKAMALLTEDRMGAFLLLLDVERAGQLTLYLRTQCGLIPYKVHYTPQHKYYFEHLPQDFSSLADLVAHHSGTDRSLFFQLAQGRVNPCYEAQDVKNAQHHSTMEPSPEEPAKTEEQPDVAPEPEQTIYHI
ncbi:LOW QUALITY PROTEIN: SH2 domain-containing protein 5 [Anomaloglossus baeobatrachus]